jgi:hypothetical protein
MTIDYTPLNKTIDQLVSIHRGDATIAEVCMRVLTDLTEFGCVDELAMQHGIDMTVYDDRQSTFDQLVDAYVTQRVHKRLIA